MKLKSFIYCLCLLVLGSTNSSLASQNYAYQLQQIAKDDELSQSYVTKSVQDDIGFIWIATMQGLKRFDGYEVKPFNGGFDLDKHSIFKLFKTNDGQLLVSTDLSGAFLINPSTLKVEKIYSGQLDNEQQFYSPISAQIELENKFYFAIDQHLFSFNKKQKKLDLEVSIEKKGSYIRALTLHQNNLYLGTNLGLYTFNLKSNQLSPITLHSDETLTKNNNDVKFLKIDKQLGLLIGTVEGMYHAAFDNNQAIEISNIGTLIKNLNIWDHIYTPNGEFIATEKGLYLYHRNNQQLEFVLNFQSSKFNLSENTINDLMLDDSGLIWLASRTHGVFTWPAQAKKFKHVSLPKNNVVNTIHEDHTGHLWFGTDEGLVRCDRNNQNCQTFLQSNDAKAVYAQFLVHDIFPSSIGEGNYIWLYNYNGLELFDTKTAKVIENKDIQQHQLNDGKTYGYAEIAVDKFAYIRRDNFYIFDGKTGTNKVIKGLKEKIDPFHAYTFHRSQSIYPDDLFISTTTALYRYNEKTGQLVTLYQSNTKSDLLYYTVENLYFDTTRSTLWLATTENGLLGIDPVTYQTKYRFNTENALRTNSIHTLIADKNGFLWFSSDNGLYQLNLDTHEIATYTIKNGLLNNKFGEIAGMLLTSGELILGTYNGAILFDPNKFIPKPKATLDSPLIITDVSLFSRAIDYHPMQYLDKPLMLSHDDMGLMIHFSNFDYQNLDNTFYQVALSGPTSLNYDDLQSNNVFFSKLPPGDYALDISATTKGANHVNKTRTLAVNVAYPPWQSPFAYTAYFISFIAILFLLFWQYRSRRIAIETAHLAAINSKKQTELSLRNNKSGIWDYDFADNSVNTLRGIELGYTNQPERIDINRFLLLIHPHDRSRVQHQWLSFIKQGKENHNHWQATYRLRHKNGHWLWFQDLGQIIYKQNSDEPLYVSGIFTNITEQLANEQQAKILGEAFSQINDYLLILDANLLPFSANYSFMSAFSTNESDSVVSTRLFINALGKAKCKEFVTTLQQLKPKESWRTNTYVRTTTAQKHPIHLNATAVANEKNEVSYYVVVITDLTEQKRAENELRYLANYDPLTRLPNRSLMANKIETALELAHQSNTQCAVLFIDLDKFKPVNDSFGHAVGDKLLCNITDRVSHCLGENACFGRQSGDEFLVLIENVKSIEWLHPILEKLSAELASKVIIEDFAINISASIGIALYPDDATTTDTLIRHADVAMMHAKQSGRNGFKFFNSQMNEQIKHKLLLENDLKDATRDNLLINHYQPIVDIKHKKVVGAELLMRWKNKGQAISPALFIPVAEETGLIETLTEQALERALKELASIFNSDPAFYISLNLSPQHILKDNIAERLLTVLTNANIKAQQLKLEITESTLLEDKHKAAKQLQKLQAAGFKLLLDDFGTGYSSLTYLSRFPINVIKIDQSFVQSIGIDRSNESIVKTIFSLAENLDVYCIAEGVETSEQLHFMTKMGCNILQGYYFARPMSASDLIDKECFNKVVAKI